MEILNENKKSSVNKVEYQAFDEQKYKQIYHNVIIQILKYYIVLKIIRISIELLLNHLLFYFYIPGFLFNKLITK